LVGDDGINLDGAKADPLTGAHNQNDVDLFTRLEACPG
jgi:hypothetical protein